jgi:hypothetical protein
MSRTHSVCGAACVGCRPQSTVVHPVVDLPRCGAWMPACHRQHQPCEHEVKGMGSGQGVRARCLAVTIGAWLDSGRMRCAVLHNVQTDTVKYSTGVWTYSVHWSLSWSVVTGRVWYVCINLRRVHTDTVISHLPRQRDKVASATHLLNVGDRGQTEVPLTFRFVGIAGRAPSVNRALSTACTRMHPAPTNQKMVLRYCRNSSLLLPNEQSTHLLISAWHTEVSSPKVLIPSHVVVVWLVGCDVSRRIKKKSL